MISFLNLKRLNAKYKERFSQSLDEIFASGIYLLGEFTEKFERAFAEYCNVKFCISTSNGLDSLKLALLACDIGPGDEVLVPTHTFIATWLAVTQVGAKPVPIDINLSTYNIDPSNIAKLINKNTKAIITVHLYGLACDMDPILKKAREFGIFVIEDAAQAHGSEYFNKKIGSLGDIAAFSFYPGKNLGSIDDAGAVITNNKDLADKVRKLRNYGANKKYVHTDLGFNARASELSCALLYIKLQDLDDIITRKNKLACLYKQKITRESIKLPSIPDGYKHSWHQFVIAVETRDKFASYLAFRGIQTLIHYPIPPMRSGAYQKAFEKTPENNADVICEKVVSLPIDPYLEENEIDFISMEIDDYFNKKI